MSDNSVLCHKCKEYFSVSGYYDHESHCIGVEPEKSPKDASAWIERVLLPMLGNKCGEYAQCSDIADLCVSSTYDEVRQFILSHRDEWKGK